jgi:branched-chain amino acid transport system substrate-binding protein
MKNSGIKANIIAAGAAAMFAFCAGAQAADKIKIGFMASFSGPNGVIGQHVRDAFNLGIEHSGGKLGDLPVEMIYADDQAKPDIGRQNADKFIERDKVDVVAGIQLSSIMMAVHGPITKAGITMIGNTAGPSPIAGAQCAPNYFSLSWQNDSFAEAMGVYLQKQGVQNVYLMAPNYQGGKDVLAGLKRTFKGKILGEVYTPLTQLDFAAELAQLRNAKPAAVFAFYPGGLGIQFVQQYAQAGLRDQIPLYTAYTVDGTSLPALGEAAIGVSATSFWNTKLDNPANKRFVTDFVKKYGYEPSEYAAQAYDAARLLDNAVHKINGKIEDKDALHAALRSADFQSIRGPFKFNNNHFPIQSFYINKVVKGADGKPALQLGDRILRDHADSYAVKCPLKGA